ncbi:DUF397 domain-containing protein [Actinoalloteichus hymeniacidonis]|uniref:DUF397 family protein n=1 Tax=Actinoalloteichus hymeniacidonis TaxID=340345 RepID=A0AAC9HUJ4_9PSEU|nr:DUF397 domain-containing protein [Actinoalloteichus hymeniacidonis]AOS65718.1 putative DUF397 family protein [Actinoalloteichus hymeniacidonis]MBB5906192.1 hypothetical protein [Actinoalloteichus hymeniacidonis]
MANTSETWKKSSKSTNESCIEVRHGSAAFGIRDSKDRTGGLLIVKRSAFEALLTAVKSGRLG